MKSSTIVGIGRTVSTRRTQLLDAALRVIATGGLKNLTHRAVDAEAGLPQGSTTYYFRSRADLVNGCADRLLEHETTPHVSSNDNSDDLIDAVTQSVVDMLTTDRSYTLARLELTLAAIHDSKLKTVMQNHDMVAQQWEAQLLTPHGIAQHNAAKEIGAVVDGLVLSALLLGPEEPHEIAKWARPTITAVIIRYLAQ